MLAGTDDVEPIAYRDGSLSRSYSRLPGIRGNACQTLCAHDAGCFFGPFRAHLLKRPLRTLGAPRFEGGLLAQLVHELCVGLASVLRGVLLDQLRSTGTDGCGSLRS
ncbi:MAG: hypothetical protein ACTIB2_08900, partial [Brachybacterium tyrofermentans]